jgi:hypothetical protein
MVPILKTGLLNLKHNLESFHLTQQGPQMMFANILPSNSDENIKYGSETSKLASSVSER